VEEAVQQRPRKEMIERLEKRKRKKW